MSDEQNDLEETERIRRDLIERRQRSPLASSDLLSTGSTLVNLAMTGRAKGGLVKGCYYLFVGDSDSGKTWIGMSCFAEANINPNFADYRFIFDQPEHGAQMDWEAYFGEGIKERIEPPSGTAEDPEYSQTTEQLYFNLDNAIKDGRPFIYLLDSVDTLDSEASEAKFQERKKAYEKGKDKPEEDTEEEDNGKVTARTIAKPKGTYDTDKPKIHSQRLRRVVSDIARDKSIVVFVNQSRDNVGGGPFEPSKTRSGGNALVFWATAQIWTSIRQKIKDEIEKKNREIGTKVQVKIKRTRSLGRSETVLPTILHGHGIDDIGDCIDYLVEENHWKKAKGGIIQATEWEVAKRRTDLIKFAEEGELERDLRSIVQTRWNEIANAMTPERKSRY